MMQMINQFMDKVPSIPLLRTEPVYLESVKERCLRKAPDKRLCRGQHRRLDA